jgi:hypothetical protein
LRNFEIDRNRILRGISRFDHFLTIPIPYPLVILALIITFKDNWSVIIKYALLHFWNTFLTLV